MNFTQSDTHQMLGDTLDRFARGAYPLAGRPVPTALTSNQSPHLQALGDLGAISALFADADGGYGGAGGDIAVVFESLGRGLVAAPILGALMVGRVIAAAGSQEQKEILPGLIDGTHVGAFAHEEPGAHYELARVHTHAVLNPSSWHLTGKKSVVLYGQQAQSFLVSARTSGEETQEQGISLFLVPATAQGLTCRGFRCHDGGIAADLSLEDVRLPLEFLVGREGEGYALLEWGTSLGVLALCSEALGAMEQAKQLTVSHLQTRRQFGSAIGHFQALQHRMAVIALEVEQARSAVTNAVQAMGQDRLTRERTLSAAKHAIGRIGVLVAEECIQLHGAMGMTWEAPVSHYAKRLIMIDTQLGDEDHHLQRYIELSRG